MDVLTKYPHKSAETASRIIDGEAVVVIPQEGSVKVFNNTGSRIWELMDGKKKTQEIIDTLVAEFEVSQEELQTDTIGFLQELADKKMAVLSDEPTD
jgi:anthranilate phosphoribosyltransferase